MIPGIIAPAEAESGPDRRQPAAIFISYSAAILAKCVRELQAIASLPGKCSPIRPYWP
jgi:hypothetical protein